MSSRVLSKPGECSLQVRQGHVPGQCRDNGGGAAVRSCGYLTGSCNQKTALFRQWGRKKTQIERQRLIDVGKYHIPIRVVWQLLCGGRRRRGGGAEALAAGFALDA